MPITNKEKWRRYWAKYPEKILQRRRDFYKKNPEKYFVYNLRKYHGMELADFTALVAEQGGTCAMCDVVMTRKTANVDHDHITGKVRGILCRKHNLALGLFGDNIAGLQQAVSYLGHPQRDYRAKNLRFSAAQKKVLAAAAMLA